MTAVTALIASFVMAPVGAASAQGAQDAPAVAAALRTISVADASGNDLSEKGIALVDWDGYIANPAVKILLRAPADISFPATVELVANNARLYFDNPSSVGAQGPQKSVEIPDASTPVPVYLSVFPDRDTADKDFLLTIRLTGASGEQQFRKVRIHVFDQDKPGASGAGDKGRFSVTLDYSNDTLQFFGDPRRQEIVQQAADDWAYFIDNSDLDAVPAGSESTRVFAPVGFAETTIVKNQSSYTGFLLYLYGVHSEKLHAGGEGSHEGGFQSSHGRALPLRRSGDIGIEKAGNYNTLGWLMSIRDNDCWRSNNRGEQQNDLYSIVHHEMGHSLGFNDSYPRDREMKTSGVVTSPEIMAYYGRGVSIDGSDHLQGAIDPASRRPAFGNEYNGQMPEGRWLITKLDILCLEAIGYRIRRTFDLAILPDGNESSNSGSSALPAGSTAAPYQVTLQARGGVPWYEWAITAGSLPEGLSLDADTGVISGMPQRAGNYAFTVRLRDSAEKRAEVTMPMTIRIQ